MHLKIFNNETLPLPEAKEQKVWAPFEDEYIIDNYELITCSELAHDLSVSVIILKQRLKRLKIKKSEAAISRISARKNSGQIEKGNIPLNTLEDGAITIRTDKTGRPYKWIRISAGKWRMLHVYNWEKINGPLSKEFILRFKDGDTMNCEPENMLKVTRAQHLWMNQIGELSI